MSSYREGTVSSGIVTVLHDVESEMRGRDVLLTPTLPITATPVDEVDEVATPLATFTRVANYLGICALSLPAGMSADRLPVAVQLMGAPFAEATLIRAGRAFQQATEWHLQRPDLSAWESALPREIGRASCRERV